MLVRDRVHTALIAAPELRAARAARLVLLQALLDRRRTQRGPGALRGVARHARDAMLRVREVAAFDGAAIALSGALQAHGDWRLHDLHDRRYVALSNLAARVLG
jgi:hypothetical protein